jgi:hypothetical protein
MVSGSYREACLPGKTPPPPRGAPAGSITSNLPSDALTRRPSDPRIAWWGENHNGDLLQIFDLKYSNDKDHSSLKQLSNNYEIIKNLLTLIKMKKDSSYWNKVLSAINGQKEKAIALLKERHGDDFSQPLAEKFREYPKLIIVKDVWSGINDLPVKDWYFETNAILENLLNQKSDCLKKFTNNYKQSIQIEHFGFDSLNSGDFLKSSISILEDCSLFFEKKIESLTIIERTNQNNNKKRTDTLPSPNLENEQIMSNGYKIFISRIEEHKEIADKLKKFLEKIFPDKVKVFVANDPVSIPFSQDWFESIKDGIKKCNLMIILSTPESLSRPWINFEAGAATILNKKIGPICFQGQRAGNLPSPLNYIRSQAIDCYNDENFVSHFENLIQIIANEIGISVPIVDLIGSDFYQSIKSGINNERSNSLVSENTRKFISEKDSVKLFDLVNNERLAVYSETSSDDFEIDNPKLSALGIQVNDELYLERFARYEQIIKPLCRICSTIAYFDDENYGRIILPTMENLICHHQWRHCNLNLKGLENYPIYLLNVECHN